MNASKPHGPDEIVTEIDLDLQSEPTERRAVARDEPSSSLTGTLDYRGNKSPVRINDLSLGGVGITAQTALRIGEDCQLVIQLSVCGSDYELQIRSRIRHCEPVDSKAYHAGLQFIDMSQSTRDTLKLLIP